jgi:rhodanese-related sulfurtransferase
MQALPLEISPLELNRKLRDGEAIRLIDVREPHEFNLCRIDGAELIPMQTIPRSVELLKSRAADGTLVFYCHVGVRSLTVVSWLRQRGLASCQSLRGGIDRWAASVDPGIRRY